MLSQGLRNNVYRGLGNSAKVAGLRPKQTKPPDVRQMERDRSLWPDGKAAGWRALKRGPSFAEKPLRVLVASAGPWEHTDSTPQGDGRGRRHRSLHCEAAAAAGLAMSTATSMVSWCSGTWLGAHSAVCTPMLSNVRRPGLQGGSNEGIGDPGTEPARG